MIESGESGYSEKASQAVRELGGYFVIDSAHLDLESSALMTRIKDQLDPDGVLFSSKLFSTHEMTEQVAIEQIK